MKVSELVYSILDLAKAAASDDSYLTEEHVLFLCKKYRAFLLKKEQEKEKGSQDVASEFEYQQICLDLERVYGDPCLSDSYMRSIQKIPKIMEGTQPRVYPMDYYQGLNVSYVSRDRMRYIGSNPYLQNIIFVSLDSDQHLHLKSSNPQFMYLRQIRMSAVFEDLEEAADLLCDDSGASQSCDVMDMEFPIREYLVPPLIELVVKALTGANILKPDEKNNAKDDTPDLNRRS